MPTAPDLQDESPQFDAASWLGGSVVGGHQLRPEAVAAVSNFTLMWNMFEGLLCPRGANAVALERVAQQIAQHYASIGERDGVQPYLTFWTFRYRTSDGFNERFEGLHFRRPDRRELVEAVLRGEAGAPEDQVLAVLLVVFRIRNNLFHGLKTIAMLNDQVANLNMAARALAHVMESSGHYTLRHVAGQRTRAANVQI
jgi:hypothetical protein